MVIIDMDMPKNCYECPFLMGDKVTGIVVCDICNEVIDISEIDKERSDVCPMKGLNEQAKRYCDNCLHKNVCGLEGANDEAMTYCADKLEED